ncbi:MAG: ABC transporter ATP-binding protein [Candidatus Shapirobacteria bacterium]|jgi:ABC-type polysaccharide/polyol phosphate transport system ATPase subunit
MSKFNAPKLQNSNTLPLQSSNTLTPQSSKVPKLQPSDVPIIQFSHVTKDFSLQNQKTFKEFLPALFLGEKTVNKFTALSDISFEIQRGECVGIIGPNGSGKSTILKLVAGVMSPTSGKVTVEGKISPLIELGAGMHPELSGKENIYLNGSILGLKKSEINNYLQSIIDFAQLVDFIDQPVKHYSSGMYMRLAFAVAVHVDPEILIVDEILAVGDSAFQEKCFQKMEEFKAKGVTILFVSHSMTQVQSFCSRVIYLNHSKLVDQGTPEKIIERYQTDQVK